MLEHTSLAASRPSRSGAIDFLRVLGIVAVVMGHVGAWSGPFIRESVYTWHVPLFFFLSGYLWSEGRSLMSEVRKRAKTLLTPYAIWLVLVGLWWLSGMKVVEGAAIKRLIFGGSYIGGPLAAFWFVTALFVAVIVLRGLQRLPVWAQWALALAAVAVVSLESKAVAQIPLSVGVGCACVIFVLAGRAFKRVRFSIRRPLITGVVVLAGCAAVILAGWSTYLDLKYAQLGTPVMAVAVAIGICSALVLIAEEVIPALGTRFNSGVSILARCGFMVVLTHAVVLVELTKLNVEPWLVFAGAVAGPWIVALLVLRTELAPFLLGSPMLKEVAGAPEPARAGRH